MAYTDRTGQGQGEPALGGFTVTPDDDTGFVELPRALYVGVTGDVAVNLVDGTSVTFVAVPAGTFLPIRATHVKSTGTTASGIIGLY